MYTQGKGERVKVIAKKMRNAFAFFYTLRPKSYNLSEGFTLVEMIVSIALFSVVMIVCTGALLAIVGANRKAQALQSVINNLNISLDGMVRAVRMGSNYHCGSGNYALPQDCNTENGETIFAFLPFGVPEGGNQWVYSYDETNKSIMRSTDGSLPIAITAPEVDIEYMRFFVVGTTRGCTVDPCDTIQPKVVMVVKGSAPTSDSRARTTFHIQVTAVQRLLDL